MELFKSIKHSVRVDDFAEPGAFNKWMTGAILFAVTFCVVGLFTVFSMEGCRGNKDAGSRETAAAATNKNAKAVAEVDLFNPVRPAPASFPPASNMPRGKESKHSGAIDLKTFRPDRDLVRFEDARVLFANDSDNKGDKAGQLIHIAVETPLKRLVNLVEKRGGKLKLHAGYCAADQKKTIYLENSLHREGRAVSLTSAGMSLSELAKLCWQAGFDFVLYEVPADGKGHLHCSVKR